MLRAFLLTFLILLAAPVHAEPVSDPDRSAIQGVISQQLEAFRVDDGARAFSHAAPNIRAIFKNPEMFMAMVKQGYMPLYRAQRFSFGATGEDFSQRVTIIGPDGKTYEALYTMQRQPDGSWGITGCSLLEVPGVAA